MENIHEGHRQRIRERIQKNGFNSLTEHEKLEALLFAYIPRKNTNDIAHNLIKKFGSFAKVLDASERDLMAVKGMTSKAALYLAILPYVVETYRESKQNTLQKVNSSGNAIDYFKIHIGMLNTEVIQVLCLNIKRKLEHIIRIDSKNCNMVSIQLPDLVSEIARSNAKYIIVGHNHPSGDVTPSRQDYEFVSDLMSSLKVLGIELIDSIIVSKENSLSFRDSLLLPEYKLPTDQSFECVANTFFGWGKTKK